MIFSKKKHHKTSLLDLPWGKIFLALLIPAILVSIFTSYLANRVYSDTTGWVDAAIDAKDANQIASNLKNAKEGMYKWKATDGNAFLLFGTPSTDMGEIMKNLDSYINKAQGLTTLDKTSEEYTNGIEDLNDSNSYFSLMADEYWLRHQGLLFYLLTSTLDLLTFLSFVMLVAKYFKKRAHGAKAN